MYNPEARNQGGYHSSRELKEIHDSVDEMSLEIEKDGLGYVENFGEPVPVLEVSSDSEEGSERSSERSTAPSRTESGDIGRRISRMERRRLKEEALARSQEYQAGQGQEREQNPVLERVPGPSTYPNDKQRRRWLPFFRRKSEDTTSGPVLQPQSVPYFSSNNGKRMIVNTPNYGYSTLFRREEAEEQSDNARATFYSETFNTTNTDYAAKISSFLDASRDSVSPEQPLRESVTVPVEPRRPILPELKRQVDAQIRKMREANPPEDYYRPPRVSSDNPLESDIPPANEVEVAGTVEPAAIIEGSEEPSEESSESAPHTTGEDENNEHDEIDFNFDDLDLRIDDLDSYTPFDEEGKEGAEVAAHEESAEPTEIVGESSESTEEDDSNKDDGFDFDNFDPSSLDIPSFEEEDKTEAAPQEASSRGEESTEEPSEPETASPEEAIPEVSSKPSDAPVAMSRMRVNIPHRSPTSALNKSTAGMPRGKYNPYTDSFIKAQWREDADADSSQTA